MTGERQSVEGAIEPMQSADSTQGSRDLKIKYQDCVWT
jgi:hypothetical protein